MKRYGSSDILDPNYFRLFRSKPAVLVVPKNCAQTTEAVVTRIFCSLSNSVELLVIRNQSRMELMLQSFEFPVGHLDEKRRLPGKDSDVRKV